MSEFVNKEELLRRIDEHSGRLAELLTRILPHIAMESGAEGTWSIKDVLAHMIGWQQFALGQLQAALAGQPLSAPPADVDLHNAQLVEASRTLPFDVVLGNWRRSVQAIKDAVTAIPDGEFAPNSALQQRLGASINDAIADNTYGHWEEHFPVIAAWLSGH